MNQSLVPIWRIPGALAVNSESNRSLIRCRPTRYLDTIHLRLLRCKRNWNNSLSISQHTPAASQLLSSRQHTFISVSPVKHGTGVWEETGQWLLSPVGKVTAIPDTWTQILSDFMVNKCGYFRTSVPFPLRDPDPHGRDEGSMSPLSYSSSNRASFGCFRL